MTHRQIEASREARLWIAQVIVPAIAIVTAVVSTVPEFREAVTEKVEDVKHRIKYKFHR